jgi:pyruvate formate lyase activating enzyme
MKKQANFWESLADKKVSCKLCSHNCSIKNFGLGFCGVRRNEDGILYSLIYGSCSSIASDPIEKKPLYHFHPGTNALSLGTIGCNFKCEHCQNYSISTADLDYKYIREIMPKQIVELARKYECQGIAWTYNEPSIWYEYSYDSARLANKEGLYNVYVSNGYISKKPLEKISPYLDAINIDVKSFNDDFYKKICKARLKPVLTTCENVKKLGIHLELTYLVIPDHNDSNGEVEKFCNWIIDKLGSDTPLHFSRYHPDYKMTDVSTTPIKTLLACYDIAKKTGVEYVYLGNVPHDNYENTICPSCKNTCIERHGFSVKIVGLKNGKCVKCDNPVPII